MAEPRRELPVRTLQNAVFDPDAPHEWLVTNGIGGYASGTVHGPILRRYHGLLIAALPNPRGRMMMLNALAERIRLPDRAVFFAGPEKLAAVAPHELAAPASFCLEGGLPIWRYEVGPHVLEKRVFMTQQQNTVYVVYRLISEGGPVRLTLRPGIHFRPYDAPVHRSLEERYVVRASDEGLEVFVSGAELPQLRLTARGSRRRGFTYDTYTTPDILYETERNRGYESEGTLWSPGYFRFDLAKGEDAVLIASTESWETLNALTPQEALAAEQERLGRLIARAAPPLRQQFGAELVVAADHFIIKPVGRIEDAARAAAAGDELRSVIAGYHWFTDWGRDTMISLEGLALTTGRHGEAAWILRTFSHYMDQGLIPNLFPEGETKGLYHTADATLWFVHAIGRYLAVTQDRETLSILLPKMRELFEWHMRGTKFGIGVDPADGLLRQGAEGFQLTWMDAKVGDWVVTPRRGKAVEINALWYNALRFIECWCNQEGDKEMAARVSAQAESVYASFNQRFWYEQGGYLYDVVDGEDGNDAAFRPNQIFAVSLPYPVLRPDRWAAVVQTVKDRLLTPFGLRSLDPAHPDYKPKYSGDLRARDAAYHQGTVWAWLIGAFIDAWLRVYPERLEEAHSFLHAFPRHLSQACVGSIGEIFDAEKPFTPRGCIAQAWSVAEVLRSWVKTLPDASGQE